MKVLVRRGRADAPVSAAENAPLDLTRMEITEEELNSEVELLRDDEVLRRVVEETGVGGRDWFHFLRLGEGNAERVERAARRLARKLQVEPVKKTNLIAISYAADDPQGSGEGAAVGGERVPGEAHGGASPDRRVPLLRAADAANRGGNWKRRKRNLLQFTARAWSGSGSAAARSGAAEVERGGCQLPADANRTGRDAAAGVGTARTNWRSCRNGPPRRFELPTIRNC